MAVEKCVWKGHPDPAHRGRAVTTGMVEEKRLEETVPNSDFITRASVTGWVKPYSMFYFMAQAFPPKHLGVNLTAQQLAGGKALSSPRVIAVRAGTLLRDSY